MFGKILGKDELLEELEALTGEIKVDEPIPQPPTNQIESIPSIPNAPTTKIEVAQQEEQEEDEFEERMKKLEAV